MSLNKTLSIPLFAYKGLIKPLIQAFGKDNILKPCA